MKKKIFLACAALVVSAAAVVGVKAYNNSQLSDFALANIEALSQAENTVTIIATCKRVNSGHCEYKCKGCGREWYNSRFWSGYELISARGYCSKCDTQIN